MAARISPESDAATVGSMTDSAEEHKEADTNVSQRRLEEQEEDDDAASDPYEDGSDSDDSAGLGDTVVIDAKHEERKKRRQQKKDKQGAGGALTKKTADFVKARNELKERVMKEVMREVLPDIGQYDVNIADAPSGKHWYDSCHRLCKFLGCISLDIHEAVLSGSESQVEATLLKLHDGKVSNRELINAYDKRGCTALSYAVKTNQQAMAHSIVHHKINTNVPDVDTGRTPLFFAGRQGNFEMVKILLAGGANPSYSDYDNITPFMMAASRDDYRSLAAMIKQRNYFLEVDTQDKNGWSALHYAVYANGAKSCKLLCNAGADKALKDFNKRSPMHLAKHLDYGDCIAILEDTRVKLSGDI